MNFPQNIITKFSIFQVVNITLCKFLSTVKRNISFCYRKKLKFSLYPQGWGSKLSGIDFSCTLHQSLVCQRCTTFACKTGAPGLEQTVAEASTFYSKFVKCARGLLNKTKLSRLNKAQSVTTQNKSYRNHYNTLDSALCCTCVHFIIYNCKLSVRQMLTCVLFIKLHFIPLFYCDYKIPKVDL